MNFITGETQPQYYTSFFMQYQCFIKFKWRRQGCSCGSVTTQKVSVLDPDENLLLARKFSSNSWWNLLLLVLSGLEICCLKIGWGKDCRYNGYLSSCCCWWYRKIGVSADLNLSGTFLYQWIWWLSQDHHSIDKTRHRLGKLDIDLLGLAIFVTYDCRPS